MSEKTQTPPPAYFLSLSLENVRSFGDKQTISFARPDGRPAQWTIILGDNGVGKTTVLKSLAASAPTREPQDKGLFFPAYAHSFYPYWLTYRQQSDKQSKIDINIAVGFLNPQLEYTGDTIHSIFQELLIKPRTETESFITAFTPIENEILGLWCYGYGAGRTVGNSTLSVTSQTVDTCASLFDDRADLLNPEEWFLQMEYSSLKQDTQAGKALEQVRQALLQVLPDVTDIRISSKGHQQFLELETPYGWVRLRDMSLGYQTLVVWLTDFASKLFLRYPDSPNPLEEPAIVLIDEIDLHLHPSWQRKLLGFLSGIFKNTQFIATAHSPLVVQAAGDEGANVVLLRREGDQTVVVTDVEDVRGWRLDQIMTSELFGLETARSPQTEEKLQRRAELLTKTNRTTAEQQELEHLTQELNAEPLGETPSELEVNAVLQELRQRLQQKGSDASVV